MCERGNFALGRAELSGQILNRHLPSGRLLASGPVGVPLPRGSAGSHGVGLRQRVATRGPHKGKAKNGLDEIADGNSDSGCHRNGRVPRLMREQLRPQLRRLL